MGNEQADRLVTPPTAENVSTSWRRAQLQVIYQEAREAAMAEHGEDYSHYAGALRGMAAVLTAQGRPATWRDLNLRWHYPLASAEEHVTIADWAKWLDGAILQFGIPHSVRSLSDSLADWHSTRKIDNATGSCRDEAGIVRAAEHWIDTEIKMVHGTRRGTKRYKELAMSVRDEAIAGIRQQLREELQRALTDFKRWLADESEWENTWRGHAGFAKDVRSHLDHYILKAEDVAALLGETEGVRRARLYVAEALSQLKAREDHYQHYVEEAERVLAGAPAPSPQPTGA
jgi:hypothetical protein